MGLYDGDRSSTAMVAEALDLPVVLVVDASAGMESVAATALGFREYASHAGSRVEVVGIIAQRAHGGRHERGIKEALPEGMVYFGRIAPDEDLEIPDRHLGLRIGEEAPLSDEALDHGELRAKRDALTAAPDESLRGHEFHYTSADVGSDARFTFDGERGEGIDGEHDGLVEHRVLGIYCHVHPESGAFDGL